MPYTLSEWDDYDTVSKQYPLAKYEWIAVKDQTECDGIIATRVWSTGKMLCGELRWFGPKNGVMIIKREEKVQDVDTVAKEVNNNAFFYAVLFVCVFALVCNIFSMWK